MKLRDTESLENLIDHYSLEDVLASIEGICLAKADHIANHWQDYPLAKRWRAAARKISGPICYSHTIQIPGISNLT